MAINHSPTGDATAARPLHVEQIAHEIGAALSELSPTVDALGERLNPLLKSATDMRASSAPPAQLADGDLACLLSEYANVVRRANAQIRELIDRL